MRFIEYGEFSFNLVLYESVGCNGWVGLLEVIIDDVVKFLDENEDDIEVNGCSSDDLWLWWDVWWWGLVELE